MNLASTISGSGSLSIQKALSSTSLSSLDGVNSKNILSLPDITHPRCSKSSS